MKANKYLNFQVIKKDIISPQKILKNFEKINKTSLTFGVHAEDNDNHAARDSLIDKKLHSALYGDTKPIGNAALLKKNTNGFTTTFFVNGKPKEHIEVPARPILKPMIDHLVYYDVVDDYFRSGLMKQISFQSSVGLKTSLNSMCKYLDYTHVKAFVESRGGSYWETEAKHNSPYVAAIKTLEMLGEEGAGNVYNKRRGTINNMNYWAEGNFFKYGDRPLIDSYDMIKSIKAKVNTK